MPFAAAVSEHPVPAHAIGEALGQVVEAIGTGPDLAVLFVTGHHVGALEDIVDTIHRVLRPRRLLGATAVGVVGPSHGVEDSTGLSLWAGRFDALIEPVRLDPNGLADEVAVACQTFIVLADPFTFPTEEALTAIGTDHPHLAVIGGLASSARGPGGNRLVLDHTIYTDGAVGVLLDGHCSLVVSQGCRPIGEPWTVTRADGNVVFELGGKPALERLFAIVDALPHTEREALNGRLHAGIGVDHGQLEFTRGDFLVRGLLGGDRTTGAIAVGADVPVGSILQFQVRDSAAAGDDLVHLLTGEEADGALVFTCNGRGAFMFGSADHDPALVTELLRGAPIAGMFCAGELGPIGGRSALHGFTASIALFHD